MSRAVSRRTFSEHWHLVSDQRLWLLPTVQVERHEFEGGRWHVLHDPLHGQYFRLHPAAWNFVARLAPGTTVEQAWDAAVVADPECAPTQQEAVRLLGQLHQASLLRGELPPDSQQLFSRQERGRRRDLKSRLGSLSSLRIPLFNPEGLLRALAPVGRLVFSWPGLLLWLGLVIWGGKTAVENMEALRSGSSGVLAPANLPWLALVFALVKAVHETGHGLACRRYGGEVREVGVMLMFLSPFPYVDTTSSWGFREAWKRVLVGAAGMIFELGLAAVAMLLWAQMGPGLVKSLAFNAVFLASVTTVLFNGNPLLRYDAYYMLADALGVPNLQQRSNLMLTWLCERYLFGVHTGFCPAVSTKEGWILVVYGLASTIYRTVLFSVLVFWVAGEYLILGLLLAVTGGYMLLLAPLLKLTRYLSSSPRLGRQRRRAVAVTVGGMGLVLGLLAVVPAPRTFRAPGVLEAVVPQEIHTQAAGILRRVRVESGRTVAKGEVLIELENPELGWELQMAQAGRERILAERRRAQEMAEIDPAPFDAALAATDRQIQQLKDRIASLHLKAPLAGRWAAPHLAESLGRWMPRGERVGDLHGGEGVVFRAVVDAGDAAPFFQQQEQEMQAQIRFHGQAGEVVEVPSLRVVPSWRETLPSAALSWAGGGEIATRPEQQEGGGAPRASTPFFEVRAVLPASHALGLSGRSGVVRFRVGSQPLLWQWTTAFLRLLQDRYKM